LFKIYILYNFPIRTFFKLVDTKVSTDQLQQFSSGLKELLEIGAKIKHLRIYIKN